MCCELRLSALLVVLCAPLAGTAGCAAPCDDDAFSCEDGGAFAIDPDCERTGALSVELGQGLEEFSSLGIDEEPVVHTGPQGGQHLWLAVRIADPALDFPLIQLDLRVEVFDVDRWIGVSSRDLVLGPELPLNGDGNVEQLRVLAILAVWPTELERRLELRAVDACGREGAAEHVIPPAP